MTRDIYKENPLNPDVPSFCRQCGQPMVIGIRIKAANSYNIENGSSTGKNEYTVRCKKFYTIWGKMGFIGYHDDFLVIENPSRDGITGKPHRTILTGIRGI